MPLIQTGKDYMQIYCLMHTQRKKTFFQANTKRLDDIETEELINALSTTATRLERINEELGNLKGILILLKPLHLLYSQWNNNNIP